MARRLPQTLGDYVAIAISPALIIAMLASFLLFAVSVFYQGDFAARISFILFMFVLGAVMTSRLAIEEGRAYSLSFALVLAVVTAIATWRFVPQSPLFSWLLIGLMWWWADRLTWDCTVIDDAQDASGQGLLQIVATRHAPAGWHSESDAEAASLRHGASADPSSTTSGTKNSWWKRVQERRRRGHTPGLWLIYFTVFTMPVFGLGQWFIPSGNLPQRRYVFQLFCLFLASALGLLMTSSFLNLRRYLRQRRITMPGDMAAGWIGMGVILIVGLLIVAAILPRPHPEYSISHLPGIQRDYKTSPWAFGNDGPHGEKDRPGNPLPKGKPDGEKTGGSPAPGGSGKPGDSPQDPRPQPRGDGGGRDVDGKQGDAPGGNKGGDPGGKGGDPGSKGGDPGSKGGDPGGKGGDPGGKGGDPGGQQGGGRDNKRGDRPEGDPREGPKGGEPGGEKSGDPGREKGGEDGGKTGDRESPGKDQPPATSPGSNRPILERLASAATWGVVGLLKLLYYVVVILGVSYLVWRYWETILLAWRQFLARLRELWDRLLGRGGAVVTDGAEFVPVPPPPPPFAAYADPFLTGDAGRWPPRELVRYTFTAFEAWAREQGCPRQDDATPHEFVRNVVARAPTLSRGAGLLAELYGRTAYSPAPITADSTQELRRLWQQLQEAAPSPR